MSETILSETNYPPIFILLFFPFGNRTPHHYHLFLDGHIIAYSQLYFPKSFAARCGHMTKFQPMGCKRKWCEQFQVISLSRKLLPLLTHDHSATSSGWDEDIALVIQLLLCRWGSYSREIRENISDLYSLTLQNRNFYKPSCFFESP